MASPRVSIVVPSWDGHRGGAVPRLLQTIDRQTFRDYEVVVVKGVFPQGRAINEGVRRSTGEYIVILDDDSRLSDEHVIERLVACLDAHPNVGMAGASIAIDPEANAFQRRAAEQFPRLHTPDVSEVTDSDLACHGCCAIRRRVFDAVGGEREDIVRGLDPDLRVRLRAAGHRVVLVPGARIYHPLPASWSALVRTFFRNGFGSAYAQKYQPDSVYDTQEEVSSEDFHPRRPLWYRLARFPVRFVRAGFRREWIRLVAYGVYALGYVYGLARAKRIETDGAGGSGTACTAANGSKAA